MTLHMSFSGGGTGSYVVKDAAGNETPIGYHYDTRKGGQSGFSLPGIEPLMTWAELRQIWPTFLSKQAQAPSGESSNEFVR